MQNKCQSILLHFIFTLKNNEASLEGIQIKPNYLNKLIMFGLNSTPLQSKNYLDHF
jgi:hypothetical protein